VLRVLDINSNIPYLINFPQVSWGLSGIDSSLINQVVNTYRSNRFKPHAIIRWHSSWQTNSQLPLRSVIIWVWVFFAFIMNPRELQSKVSEHPRHKNFGYAAFFSPSPAPPFLFLAFALFLLLSLFFNPDIPPLQISAYRKKNPSN